MTDKAFIRRVSERSGLTQKEIAKVLDFVELQMKDDFIKGIEKVKILDLNFRTSIRKQRYMHYFDTGQKVLLPTRRMIRIALSTDWEEIMRNFADYIDKE